MPGSYERAVPHFLICETTNIFFNLAWILRAVGYKNSFVTMIEISFAASFFPIRIINLTLILWLLQTQVCLLKSDVIIYTFLSIKNLLKIEQLCFKHQIELLILE